jgi:hypothetical protein
MSYPELGKHRWATPDGLTLQLMGQDHRPWLSVNDRCRPMVRVRQGMAGEDEHVPASSGSTARPR